MIGAVTGFFALRSVLGLLKLVTLIGGAATLIGMLSCGVSRIAAADRTEAELEKLRQVVHETARVLEAERAAREAAQSARKEILEAYRPLRERAIESAQAACQSGAAPRAEGDCAAGCRIPEPLRTALEKM